jgi:hypothetical protein
MELTLKRLRDDRKNTVGELYIDGVLRCYTLEDPAQDEKIPGKTRIPAGRYRLDLRRGSPMAGRYKEKYGTDGMVWLQDVPGFDWVYIHIGNTEADTDGCILVGRSIVREVSADGEKQFISWSRDAFFMVVPPIISAINAGESCWITII